MTYKRPNRKKPRVKTKSSHVMSRSKLAEFKKKYPEHKGITESQFNAIIKKFNSNIVDEVIASKNGVSLPERLGQILIMSFPRSKKKSVDFGASNKLGEVVYHRNWDTDDRLGKIVYFAGRQSVKYSNLWGLTPTRTFKLKVSSSYRKMWAKYIYVDNKDIRINTVLK